MERGKTATTGGTTIITNARFPRPLRLASTDYTSDGAFSSNTFSFFFFSLFGTYGRSIA